MAINGLLGWALIAALLAIVNQMQQHGSAAPDHPVTAIFVVSASTNVKRRRSLGRRLRLHGLDALTSWIDAFDADTLTPAQISGAYDQHLYHTAGPWPNKKYATPQPLTRPELSAAMKHIEALRRAAQLPLGTRALILEDDAVFKPGWGRGGDGGTTAATAATRKELRALPFVEQLRQCLAALPASDSDWDVLFIGEGQLQQNMHVNKTELSRAPPPGGEPSLLSVHRKRWHAEWAPYPWPMLLSRWNVARSPEAYVVHAASAAALVRAMEPFAFPIDGQLAFTLNAMAPESAVFWSEPSLVAQMSERKFPDRAPWASSGIKHHAK